MKECPCLAQDIPNWENNNRYNGITHKMRRDEAGIREGKRDSVGRKS